jgi:hypothetical protein
MNIHIRHSKQGRTSEAYSVVYFPVVIRTNVQVHRWYVDSKVSPTDRMSRCSDMALDVVMRSLKV